METSSPKYMRLRARLAISFALLAIISTGVTTLLIFLNLRTQLRQEIRERLRNEVAIAALQVDGDAHSTLTDPSQEGNTTYVRIKKVLQNIRDSQTDIRFVYTMRQDASGNILFVVDAEESAEDISHLGDIYDDAGPVLMMNFTTMDKPMTEEDFYTDRWGTWLTGYAPFYGTDGRREGILGMDIAAAKVIASERRSLWIFLGVFVAIILPLSVIGWLMGNRLASPITDLTATALQITKGNLNAQAPVKTKDELGTLAQAFNVMTKQMRDLIDNLEARVTERTRALEQRAIQLQSVAEVGRAAASLYDLDALLNQTTDLISSRFGFYHVGIFLLDELGEYAVLRAANSEGGQRLLARGHRLEIGRQGIVGAAAFEKKTHIALDTGKDAVFFDNPDLPLTHSEAALPLIARGTVIGVLDIQSSDPQVFTEENLELMRTLADQIAVAIENANLLAEGQSAKRQLETLSTNVTRRSWTERLSNQPKGYHYTPSGIKPVAQKKPALTSSLVSVPTERRQRMNIPINLRGQKIGTITLRRKGDLPWADTDQALVADIATQIALALDNARLLEDTRRRTAREETINEFTSRLSRTIDADTIMQTAIRQLHQLPDVSEVSVFIQPSSPPTVAEDN